MKTKISSITYSESSFMNIPDQTTYSTLETVTRIINLTEGLANFWKSPSGWAPIEAAELLTKSRLDWQVSLAKQLVLFQDEADTDSGRLILAWTTLGSLTEGAMKLFLSVYFNEYQAQNLREEFKHVKDRKGNISSPDELMLDKLRLFFSERVLPKNAKEKWEKFGEINWLDWILKIQQRRNAIHAFKSRDIGDFNEFHSELKNYLIFLRKINNGLPYPADNYKPQEDFFEHHFEEIELGINSKPPIKGRITNGKLLVNSKEDGDFFKSHLNLIEEIEVIKFLPTL